jgi:hypothetical protein
LTGSEAGTLLAGQADMHRVEAALSGFPGTLAARPLHVPVG